MNDYSKLEGMLATEKASWSKERAEHKKRLGDAQKVIDSVKMEHKEALVQCKESHQENRPREICFTISTQRNTKRWRQGAQSSSNRVADLKNELSSVRQSGTDSVKDAEKRAAAALDKVKQQARKDLAALEAKIKATESVMKNKVEELKEAHKNDSMGLRKASEAALAAAEAKHADARTKLEQENRHSLDRLAERMEAKVEEEKKSSQQRTQS